MEPFTTLHAVAAPIETPNVDTDQIVPARFLKFSRDGGYGQYLFHDLRFDEGGGERADFVLNRPAYRGAQILVTNTNFGCGSSREGAVYALVDYGVRCVIGPSFGDIFHNNCLKNGLLPVHLPAAEAAELREALAANPGAGITVDLEAQEVRTEQGRSWRFETDPFWREALLKGLDELGMTLGLLEDVENFEARYFGIRPWLLGD